MARRSWYDRARAIILDLHADMPADLSYAERRQILRDAYPWGSASWPYRQWCKAQRAYLAPYVPQKPMDIGLFKERKGPAS